MGLFWMEQKCPYCGKSHYKAGCISSTCAYYPPVYKDGKNINPDRNVNEMDCSCKECGERFVIHWQNDENGMPQIEVLKWEDRKL